MENTSWRPSQALDILNVHTTIRHANLDPCGLARKRFERHVWSTVVAVRPILLYPDHTLKGIAQPVALTDPAVGRIVQDMLDTLDASPGVALAAPQIGHLVQIVVVDVSRKKGETGHGLVVLLNPRILEQEEPRIIREGCLSVPDYTGNVLRYERTVVEGLTPEGQVLALAASGLEALAFQHEVDHLVGRLFLDRIHSLSTDLFRRKKGRSS